MTNPDTKDPDRRTTAERLLRGVWLAFVWVTLASAQELKPVWDGKELRVVAPGLQFLGGRVLQRLKDGIPARLDIQLSVDSGGVILRRTAERFVVSYDLWEERFSVIRLARDRTQRKSVSHLEQPAAESWCLDNVRMSTEGLDGARSITVQLEVRAEEGKEVAAGAESGISLTSLIDLFSRPARLQQPRWRLQQGPVTINALRSR